MYNNIVMDWIVEEVTHPNARREGYEYNGTLASAKRLASKRQAFHGTVLVLRSIDTGMVISYKENGVWTDMFYVVPKHFGWGLSDIPGWIETGGHK